MMQTFKIYTLGCKVNRYDSGRLAALLAARGMQEVESGAHLAIINTCSVTKATGSKNSRMVALARQQHPDAQLAIIGCWSRIYPQDERNFAEALRIAAKEPEQIVEALAAAWPLPPVSACAERLIKQDRARYFLKVQDGCQQFCSYCIIPYSRGGLWSKALPEAVAEAQAAEAAGYRELVLTGIHLGLYGQESGQSSLVALLQALLTACPRLRLRLSSIEPLEVTDELIALMAAEPRICRHLHISLQSGSDAVLRAMNRPYQRSQFAERMLALRQAMPDLAVTTDVIVGFPGESKEEFQQSLNYISQLGLAKLHVFAFSAHERAAASKLPNQLPPAVIKERATLMRGLSRQLEADYLARWAQPPFAVLVLGRRDGRWLGKDQHFFNVAFGAADCGNDCQPERGQLLPLSGGEVLGME